MKSQECTFIIPRVNTKILVQKPKCKLKWDIGNTQIIQKKSEKD